jgi:FkbM family methyltransferase
MDISLYRLKKAVLTPRTMYMRRKERDMSEVGRMIFELNYYRRRVYDFMGATMANPEILVDFELDEQGTVLDVGAYVGDWAEKVENRYHPAAIHCFEPAPGGLDQIRRRHADNDRVHIHPYGLGDRDQTASLALAGPGSSIYTDETPFGLVDVDIRDVAEVLDELGIDDADLLKVNIEGGEYDLFDRLIEIDALPRFRLVLIQFHEWHPNAYARRRRIRRALRKSHEEVWGYSWVWELWRRVD